MKFELLKSLWLVLRLRYFLKPDLHKDLDIRVAGCPTVDRQKMALHSKIVIIGAGISGLAAAEKLQQKGWTDYKILEATDRIGGRIKTLKQNQGMWQYGSN